MSAIEETKNLGVDASSAAHSAANVAAGGGTITRATNQVLNVLSSVRFGVILLISLVILSMLGMIIMQTSIEGFENYYAQLTPAQQLIGAKLGVFDIYHTWYYNALLLVLSLNIILASIDRFPKAWTFVSRPKLDASPHWLKGQEQSANFEIAGANAPTVAQQVATAARAQGWRKPVVTEKKGKTFVFAQVNAWNRLGAYAVHVALLTIFIGGFLTAQFSRSGQMTLAPGQTSDQMREGALVVNSVTNQVEFKPAVLSLPFDITCNDIQQKLIQNNGTITADNTIDWLTRVTITDKEDGKKTEALVHLNRPFDYRGYRLFQASYIASGRARSVNVHATPANGGQAFDITLPRDGEAQLPDGTKIKFAEFRGAFSVGEENPDADASAYPNPAAMLMVTPAAGGEAQRAFAFNQQMAANAPIAKQPVAGYTFLLTDFERVGEAHTLAIQHDPGAVPVYIGFALLAITLLSVFLFAHQRVWAAIEPLGEGDDRFKVTLGGNANRNRLAFAEKFNRWAQAITGAPREIQVND